MSLRVHSGFDFVAQLATKGRAPNVGCDGSTSLSSMECCGSTQLSLAGDEGCANTPGRGDAPRHARGKATSSGRAPEFVPVGVFMIFSTLSQTPATTDSADPTLHRGLRVRREPALWIGQTGRRRDHFVPPRGKIQSGAAPRTPRCSRDALSGRDAFHSVRNVPERGLAARCRVDVAMVWKICDLSHGYGSLV